MGEVLCSTENSPFLIIDHIHAKINRVCCAALAIGKMYTHIHKISTNPNAKHVMDGLALSLYINAPNDL